MKILAAFLLVVLTVQSSCNQKEDINPTEEKPVLTESSVKNTERNFTEIEVIGLFTHGFECSNLSPCGSDENWWVTDSYELVKKYYDMRLRIHEPVFVRLIGSRSELGRYGHMGCGDRLFKVKQIIEIRKRTDQDCES